MKMDVQSTVHDKPAHDHSSNQLYGVAQEHIPKADPSPSEIHGAPSGHVLRTQHNIGGEGGPLTSVKVHQAPGGNSSIAITEDKKWTGEAKNQTPFHHEVE